MTEVILKSPNRYCRCYSAFHQRLSMPSCLKELALALYKRGILSSGKACALAGLSRWEWIEVLGKRKVSRHYTTSDLEKDIAHVKRCK